MYFKEFYLEFIALFNHLQSLTLLLIRLVLAYGFANPALMKWANFDATVAWFRELGIPFAYEATFLVASLEIIGVFLLVLGLFIRLISLPLMVILLVAILMVHLNNGFSVANNGVEIPLYYFLFLSIFATHGAGRFSLDAFLFEKKR